MTRKAGGQNAPRKHHYVPSFYLSRWVGPDGKICQFQKHNGQVRANRKHPNATGFGDQLYTALGMPADKQALVETAYLAPLDTNAARALDLMDEGSLTQLPASHLTAWGKFLTSLLLRTPEEVDRLKRNYLEKWFEMDDQAEESYQERRQVGEPPTLEEYMNNIPLHIREFEALRLMATLISNPVVLKFIADLQWSLCDLPDIGRTFMTSDRPIIMTNGLKIEGGYILLPIGPKKLFMATYDEAARLAIKAFSVNELVDNVNFTVVSCAAKYVWATSDVELDFVHANISSRPPPSLLRAMGMLD